MSDSINLDKTAFVVLGMHRSGTSAMTRVLALSGASLPENIHPAGFDNPAGFWEGEDIIAFNDEVLQAFDTSWDDIFAGRPKHYLSNFDRAFTQRAVDILGSVFGNADLVVMKDPRVNVILAFWLRALRSAGYTPAPIVMVRHPLEVAASLRERNGFSTEKGLLLWLDNMIAAERDSRGMKRIFVAYDTLLSSWRECLDRVERLAGMPLPRRTTTSGVEIEKYLSPKLRHHNAEALAIGDDTELNRMVARAYNWFCEAARRDDAIDPSPLIEIEAFLNDLSHNVGSVVADLRARVSEYIRHTQGLEARVTGLDVVVAETAVALETERSAKANLEESLSQRQAQVDALEGQLAEVQGKAYGLGQELAQRAHDWHMERVGIETKVVELQAQLDVCRTEMAERDEALGLVRSEAEALHQQVLEARKDAQARLDDEHGLREALEASIADLQAQLNLCRTEMAEQDEALGLVRSQAEALEQQLLAAGEDAQARLDDERGLREALEASIADLQAQVGRRDEALAAELKVSQSDVTTLSARQKDLEDELRRVQALSEDLLREKAANHGQERASAEEVESLQRAKDEIQERLSQERARAAKLLKSLEDERERADLAEVERSEFAARYGELEAELRRVQAVNEKTMVPRDAFEVTRDKAQNLETEVEELRRARIEAIPLLREREAIVNSTSWKMTLLPRMFLTRFRQRNG